MLLLHACNYYTSVRFIVQMSLLVLNLVHRRSKAVSIHQKTSHLVGHVVVTTKIVIELTYTTVTYSISG